MVNLKKKLIILVFLPNVLWAQVNKLTLEDAYREAQTNYPVIKQKDLVRQTAELSISNLSKGNLPQLSFNPLILRLGVLPLAEGGTDFPTTTSTRLFLPGFHPMPTWKISVG